MKILIGKEFKKYNNDLRNNQGKISFNTGSLLEIDKRAKYIIPGYVDRHIHGGYGVDFMDADGAGNEKLFSRLPSEGVTRIFPTTMTMEYSQIIAAFQVLKRASNYYVNCDKVHLEGPFLNQAKIGAQNPQYLRKPDCQFITDHQEMLQIVSYAPEFDEENQFLKVLMQNNICGSIAHSSATFEEIKNKHQLGLKSYTHFYNGMSGFDHRKPGIVNAGLLFSDVYLELICDGIHVHPDVIKQTYIQKGIEAIVLITDSIRAKGLTDGNYQLGGQEVVLKNGAVRLLSGSLAGSILTMEQAVKNFYHFTKCTKAEAIYAATTNVASSVNRFDFGAIKEGLAFDIVLLDENLNVITTYVNGQKVYEKTRS